MQKVQAEQSNLISWLLSTVYSYSITKLQKKQLFCEATQMLVSNGYRGFI